MKVKAKSDKFSLHIVQTNIQFKQAFTFGPNQDQISLKGESVYFQVNSGAVCDVNAKWTNHKTVAPFSLGINM